MTRLRSGVMILQTERGGPDTRTTLPHAHGHAMIPQRLAQVGIATKVGNHSFPTTGITASLKNGGTLEKAEAMASLAGTRTTQLYGRRRDQMSLDEVDRIGIRCLSPGTSTN